MYSVPPPVRAVPIKTMKNPIPGLHETGPSLPVTRSASPACNWTYSSHVPSP